MKETNCLKLRPTIRARLLQPVGHLISLLRSMSTKSDGHDLPSPQLSALDSRRGLVDAMDGSCDNHTDSNGKMRSDEQGYDDPGDGVRMANRSKTSHSLSTNSDCANSNSSDFADEATLNKLLDSDPEDEEQKSMDDELVKKLEWTFLEQDEDMGPPIDSQMGVIINKLFSTHLPENKAKSLCEKYRRPENCVNMRHPRVNQDIGKALPTIVGVTFLTVKLGPGWRSLLVVWPDSSVRYSETGRKATKLTRCHQSFDVGSVMHEMCIYRRVCVKSWGTKVGRKTR